MPGPIVRTFKTVRNIVAPAVTCRGHRLRSRQTPASRTANEEERCVRSCSKVRQSSRKLIDKGCVGHTTGKHLPLNCYKPFPYRRQVWQADKSPLRLRSDIYKCGVWLLLEPPPDLRNLNILYPSSLF